MTIPNDDPSGDERDPVERLAEEFVARHRRGEAPSPEEYASRHPDLAERIHTLFPALVLIERHKPRAGDTAADSTDPRPADLALERLGDYRIVRELGRGGMAVVYEAEQESLGRHVALKVLLQPLALDPTRAARFQREARAAARLHHTNVVPVYGVGEHRGVPYYVMQLIPGQGLDEVLRELRRLRRQAPPCDEPRPGPSAVPGGEVTATGVALGLLSGRFGSDEPGVSGPAADSPRDDGEVAGRAEEGSGPGQTGAGLDRVARPQDRPGPSMLAVSPADSSSLSSPARHYWRGVARIGVQVADALQYSHAQGVLHRDIKPSNLLLDLHGTVWVADFGLAKLTDQADLTNTGDVVGTWRYIAPERFRGVSDARSDVYSLGLTLYELLVLKPAFQGSTREDLIRQVTAGVPPRPRRINPEVPRDLETIVLKAIERDPAARYATAGDLADDLRRFLEGRPPRARRCGLTERTWRWARRNPVVALLGASVILLLAALAVGSTFAAFRLNAERDRAIDYLWSTYLAQARAVRSTHQVGQRFTSLEVLARAARIRKTRALSDEAIASLALVDIRRLRYLASTRHEDDGFTVDPALERYAVDDGGGGVSVRLLADGRETVHLPEVGGPSRGLEFSADGRFLAALYLVADTLHGVLWDLNGPGPPRRVLERPNAVYHFSGDGRRVALHHSRSRVDVHDAATGSRERTLEVRNLGALAGYHPDGRRLVVLDSTPGVVRLVDPDGGPDAPVCSLGVPLGGVVWTRDGRLLAASGDDHRVYVWDTAKGRLQAVLEGHQNSVVRMQFTNSGMFLCSSSWDGTVRVWDPVRGTTLLTAPAELIRVGPDDGRVALREHGSVLSLWEFADARECRTLHHGRVGNRTPRPADWGPHVLDFSADGRYLASSDREGVWLWDPSTGDPIAQLPLGPSRFRPRGLDLLEGSYDASRAPRLWPVEPDPAGRRGPPRLGRPQNLGVDGLLLSPGAWDGAGRNVSLCDTKHDQAVVVDSDRGVEVARLGPHPGLTQAPLSPDGRWVATATWKGKDVMVWDVVRTTLAWRLACDSAYVAFSPDGRWLAVAPFPGRECQLWSVGTWQRGPAVHLSTAFFGAMAFSRSGRLFAVDDGGRVRLVDPATGRDVATLDVGTASNASFHCLALSPDGTYVAAARDHVIHLWDLRRVRQSLASMGLE